MDPKFGSTHPRYGLSATLLAVLSNHFVDTELTATRARSELPSGGRARSRPVSNDSVLASIMPGPCSEHVLELCGVHTAYSLNFLSFSLRIPVFG